MQPSHSPSFTGTRSRLKGDEGKGLPWIPVELARGCSLYVRPKQVERGTVQLCKLTASNTAVGSSKGEGSKSQS